MYAIRSYYAFRQRTVFHQHRRQHLSEPSGQNGSGLGLRRIVITSYSIHYTKLYDTLGVLALSVHLPVANAAVIGTEAVVAAQQAEIDRARVQDLLGGDPFGDLRSLVV